MTCAILTSEILHQKGQLKYICRCGTLGHDEGWHSGEGFHLLQMWLEFDFDPVP